MISVERNLKPEQWPWNPSRLIAPAGSILRQCEVLDAFWRPGGLPRELIKSRVAVAQVAGAVWGEGNDGISHKPIATGITEYNIPTSTSSRSFLVVFQPIALPANQSCLLGLTSVGGGSWCAMLGLQNDGDLSYYEVQGTATTIAGGDAPLGKTTAALGITQSGTGGYQRLFANGVQLATRADNDAAFTSSMTRLTMGRNPVTTHPNIPNVHYFMIAYWRRALTDAEALAVTADPYMLIRPWEFLSGQASVTIPPRSYASFIG